MKSAQDTLSIDEHFDTFFKKFQTDSIFQKSRIEFPLKYKFSGDNGENDTIKFIQKGDMKYIGLFVVNRKNAIVKKKELRPAKVEIQFQLAETGFEKDFTFEKLNNRWHLTFIVDDSD